MSEDLCPVCHAPLTYKRSGYGTDLLVCLKCGYQVENGQIKPIQRAEQTALAKETEMGWERSTR